MAGRPCGGSKGLGRPFRRCQADEQRRQSTCGMPLVVELGCDCVAEAAARLRLVEVLLAVAAEQSDSAMHATRTSACRCEQRGAKDQRA